MKSNKVWIIVIIILALVGGAFFSRDTLTTAVGGSVQSQASAQESELVSEAVTIRPATNTVQVSATGNIQLVEQQSAVFKDSGIIAEVYVEAGDEVKVGDPLLKLETDDLERAVRQAEIALEVSRNSLTQLLEPATQADLYVAYANLASTQTSLAELRSGPSETELAAAQASLTAAQASYQELLDGLSEAELTQLSADVNKAYITLQQAQEAYNEIAYRGDIGQTSQAATLQEATIDYDTAKAAYDVATEGASESEVQSALKAIKEAENQIESLEATQAELLAAEAQVASAQATLTDLLNGPTETEVHDVELSIEQAQLNVEAAQVELDDAELRATIDGIVLSIDVEVGQKTNADLSSALIIGDLTELELPVYVAEVDINKVALGQPVNIAVDALPDQLFSGEVSRIAPISESNSGVVNYEVTIHLKDLEIEDGVRPGMTAVATILSDGAENAWLVPSNALIEFEGQYYVRLVGVGQDDRIAVTPGTSQGEWTVVQSGELQAGDQVIGQVTSYVDSEDGEERTPGMGMMGDSPPLQ
jgi:HlyD family secretion protein